MINNLSLLRALLAEDGANSIHELMRPAADQVKEDMALNCDNLIQRSWLSALQSLSQVTMGVLWCVAVYYGVLRCVAVCCSGIATI